MSHGRERKEKDCLNCGTLVEGRFCQVCGQENIEPRENFWHLVTHFFYDITHFDGKFFHSLKYLFFRPGLLPAEYMAGRRVSYLNPIRMYIFTSAFFFLIFFSFFHNENIVVTDSTVNGKSITQIDQMDSAAFADFTAAINREDDKPAIPMSRKEFEDYVNKTRPVAGIQFTTRKYRSKGEYDSLLASGVKKHNWWQRQLIYKEIELDEKYRKDPTEMNRSFSNRILHSLPQLLFLSLPLLALALKLIYIRRRQFYYMNHAIFSIYLYIFIFMMLLLLFGISNLKSNFHWGFLNYVSTLLILAMFFYEYKALRNFYQQGRLKTFLKFLLINISLFFILGVLFMIFLFFSLFKL